MSTFIAHKLTDAREELGWTVNDLHLALVRLGFDVTRQSVYLWENGESVPSSNNLNGIARVLGKPMEYFFGPIVK